MTTPKFCKPCNELVYSEFCPNCSSEPENLGYLDEDQAYDDNIYVNEGTSKWGRQQDMTVLDFDEVFGSDPD